MILMKIILLLMSLKLMDSLFILRNFPLICFTVQLMSPGQILSFLQHKMFLILVSLCLSVSASSSPSPPRSPSPHFFLPLSLFTSFHPPSLSLSLSWPFQYCLLCFLLDTTQLYMIKLFPVPNGLNYTCQYREHSNLWGCGISVASSNNSIERDVTQGHLDVPCSDRHNVSLYYITRDKRSHVIGHVAITVNGSCPHPTSPGGMILCLL